jgi:hypothetical protein
MNIQLHKKNIYELKTESKNHSSHMKKGRFFFILINNLSIIPKINKIKNIILTFPYIHVKFSVKSQNEKKSPR